MHQLFKNCYIWGMSMLNMQMSLATLLKAYKMIPAFNLHRRKRLMK